MAARSAKRYYFVQISEEKFFNNVRVKALEKMGAKYVLSFQRLILEALKENDPGFLRLDSAFDSMPEQIATMLGCDLDEAESLYDALIKRQLCKETHYGLWIPLSKELTASRTEKADEMKKRREAVKAEEAAKEDRIYVEEDESDIEDDESDDDDDNTDFPSLDDVEVTGHVSGTNEEKCSPNIRNQSQEKKREETKSKETKEKSKEEKRAETKEKETREENKKLTIAKNPTTAKNPNPAVASKPTQYPKPDSNSMKRREENKNADPEESAGFRALCERVIGYLNKKVGFNWHPLAKVNKEVIKERLAEGFVEQDFYDVINVKEKQWKRNEKMFKFLRPSTLFGPKMDGYLQETLYSNVFDTSSPISTGRDGTVYNFGGHRVSKADAHKPADPNFKPVFNFVG